MILMGADTSGSIFGAAAIVGLGGGLTGLHVYLRGTAIGNRSVIDKVSAWPEADSTSPRQCDGSISLVVRNGNDHPVRIEELAYEIAAKRTPPPARSAPAPGGGYYLETSISTQGHLVGWIGTLARARSGDAVTRWPNCEWSDGDQELYHACVLLVRLTASTPSDGGGACTLPHTGERRGSAASTAGTRLGRWTPATTCGRR